MKKSEYLKTLNWTGSKSCRHSYGQGIWILGLLPFPASKFYVEPFFGSGAVMLNKPPVKIETANDINGRLVNFWQVCQSMPDELDAELGLIMWSERQFAEAQADLDCDDPLRRAVALAVVLEQRQWFPVPEHEAKWMMQRVTHTPPRLKRLDVRALARRLADVQITERCALDVLYAIRNMGEADVYCDPPYKDHGPDVYGQTVDFGRLSELLLEQKGRVAVSGAGSEWDHLGWRKEVFVRRANLNMHVSRDEDIRLEALWMNYPPNSGRLF